MSRRALQLVNGLVAVATVALGVMQMALGTDSPVYGDLPADPALDSNLRFFGGMALGLGLLLLWILPSIERRTALYRAVWLCAFLGGVGRLVSAALVGAPSPMLLGFTVLEVGAAPLLVYWQARVAA
jgi:hypothetical protein